MYRELIFAVIFLLSPDTLSCAFVCSYLGGSDGKWRDVCMLRHDVDQKFMDGRWKECYIAILADPSNSG